MRVWVAPVSILAFVMGLTAGLAGFTLLVPAAAPLLPELLWREGIDLRAFTWTGGIWLALAGAVYVLADYCTGLHLRGRPAPPSHVPHRLLTLCIGVNALFLATIAIWLGLASAGMGGPLGLIHNVVNAPLAARDTLLAAKLFPGMRLFYAGLSVTSALIYALWLRGRLSAAQSWVCGGSLLVNLLVLMVLPLVMSQRLLLLHALCALVITDVLLRRRVGGLAAMVGVAVAFLAVWLGREALTNTTLHGPATSVGLQKLLFYAVNDMWNGFAPLAQEIEHSFGALTLRAPAVLLSLDVALARFAAAPLAALEDVRGGGEFPLLTLAYVDFGALGGAAFLAALAVVIRWVFWRAQAGELWAVGYAQIGAGLVLAPHSAYVLHQNVLFALLLLAVMAWAARHVDVPTVWRRVYG